MNDKVRFHNMTKPIKFRRLKQMKMMTVLWCKALRERTIYLFNYLLYKLKILKRYSYRDKVAKVISTSNIPLPELKEVISKYVKGIVMMRPVSETDIDIDYFYRERRDGSRKITLWVKNEKATRIFVDSYLKNICLRVGDKWYDVDKLPVFKATILSEDILPKHFNENESLRPVEVKTVSYDTAPLRKLRHRSLIQKCSTDDFNIPFSEKVLEYYYVQSYEAFVDALNKINLEDLIL